MTPIERHADAILRAAGSSLSHYTTPATHQAILDATEATYEAGRKAGWQAFGEMMMVQLGPYMPDVRKGVWQPIETAPKDEPFIGGYFGQPWAESHREGRIVQCWWQEEFDCFISSCREMTMAPGYTIDGQASHLHSEVREDVTHWMPLPAAPNIGGKL